MLNQVILVGRMAKEVEVNETESGQKICTITLAVLRNYKNIDGIYEKDLIKCILWNGIADNVREYCKKEDLIGIKGRIENKNDEMLIIAEKVTFLSSRSSENMEEK